jgi:putative transcriptional regulator
MTTSTQLLQRYLNSDPEAGAIVPGSGGVRKVRWRAEGRGKRGGLRVIYFAKLARGEIWMLTIYGKNVQENIPAHVLRAMRKEIGDAQMTKKQLSEWEKTRNVGEEILEGLREIKAGRGRRFTVDSYPIIRAREKSGLSQAQFAGLLGVSVRTLQDWEQGRREPSAAAKTLIKIAELYPHVLKKVAA